MKPRSSGTHINNSKLAAVFPTLYGVWANHTDLREMRLWCRAKSPELFPVSQSPEHSATWNPVIVAIPDSVIADVYSAPSPNPFSRYRARNPSIFMAHLSVKDGYRPVLSRQIPA